MKLILKCVKIFSYFYIFSYSCKFYQSSNNSSIQQPDKMNSSPEIDYIIDNINNNETYI